MQNGNNTEIITFTINSSRCSLLWGNRVWLSENQEDNKSLYPDCTLVTQDLLTLLYSNRTNNDSV